MKPTRIQLSEHVYSVYSHHLNEGETLETALEPNFWSHVAKQLRPGDRIELTSYDASWLATLYVQAVSRIEAVVAVLSKTDLGAPAMPKGEVSPYEVAFRGPRKWSIVHAETREVLKEDIETKQAADTYLKNHMQALAA